VCKGGGRKRTDTHGDVFAPDDGPGQRVPELHDPIEPGGEELAKRRVWTQRPQFVGVTQHGRAEAHRQRTDQYTIASGSDEQLRPASFGHGTNAAQMFGHLRINTCLSIVVYTSTNA